MLFSYFSISVLYVGLVPTFMEVNEADGEVFACVQVFETYPGPVIRDLTVRIGTQDDTAVGRESYTTQNRVALIALVQL